MTSIKPSDLTRLTYLASPYSRFPGGHVKAFEETARLAAKLLREGMRIFSPITHCHPIALYGDIDPLDHDIWLPFDEAMMDACEYLLVARMPGWQDSKGIAHEIELFQRFGKPIFHLDPDSMTIFRV